MSDETTEQAPAQKRRGRPPKAKTEEAAPAAASNEDARQKRAVDVHQSKRRKKVLS